MMNLPADVRAKLILDQILAILPTKMADRNHYAKLLAKRFLDNTNIILEFTAASIKDRVEWEVTTKQFEKL